MTEYRGQKTEVSVTPKAMFFISRYLGYKKMVFTGNSVINRTAVPVFMRSQRGRSLTRLII